MRLTASRRAAPALLVLALASCGSDPTPIPTLTLAPETAAASVSAEALIPHVVRAVAEGGETHLTGTYTEPLATDADGRVLDDAESSRRTLTLDVQGRPGDYTAVIDMAAVHVELERRDDTVTVRGNDALGTLLGEAIPEQGLDLPADDQRLAAWLAVTDIPTLVASILDTDRAGVDFGVLDDGLVLTISAGGSQTGTVTLDPTMTRPLAISVSDDTGIADLTFTWQDE